MHEMTKSHLFGEKQTLDGLHPQAGRINVDADANSRVKLQELL